MRGWRSAKVSTIREEFDEINDSMKVSSSRMKNKAGAQKGAFIKMKQENIYIYQREFMVCYVPIIAPFHLLHPIVRFLYIPQRRPFLSSLLSAFSRYSLMPKCVVGEQDSIRPPVCRSYKYPFV